MKYLKLVDGLKSNANGFEYKIGEINIAKTWNPTTFDPALMGGFNFSVDNKILRWIHRGDTIYDVEIGNVHIGIIGGIEEGLDDLGMSDILCTSSIRAIREIEPKLVVAMGNVDGMVSELKLTARAEKKLKVKSLESLPTVTEVVALS